MTRVGVMTFLHNDNYGSMLQAWALQQALISMGFETEHIDYAPSKQEKLKNLILSGNSPKLVLEGMRKRGATGKMHGGFDEFRCRHVRTSAPCADKKALKACAEAYDVLVCGSDQIWSPVWLNPVYFLNFTDRPKVSYAPSLGVQELPPRRKQRKISRLMKSFAAISVREEEGAALLKQMSGREAAVLPDPVMLVDRARWQSVASDDVPSGGYILCYFIGDSPAYWQKVEEISRCEKLPVRVIPRTEDARASGYTLEENVPPQRWLGLINAATHVVTDSFHGAAFSAILNKPCTILRRYREEDPERKNSRIDQLLRNIGVTDLATPDWAQVNEHLAALADSGKKWLLDAVSQAASKAHPAERM